MFAGFLVLVYQESLGLSTILFFSKQEVLCYSCFLVICSIVGGFMLFIISCFSAVWDFMVDLISGFSKAA